MRASAGVAYQREAAPCFWDEASHWLPAHWTSGQSLPIYCYYYYYTLEELVDIVQICS